MDRPSRPSAHALRLSVGGNPALRRCVPLAVVVWLAHSRGTGCDAHRTTPDTRTAVMNTARIARLLTAPVLTTWALLLGAPMQTVSAEPCPDVEVVFARGTSEAPGVGGIGQAFVDALRSQVGGETVAVYPVNYAASSDFNDRIQFARTVVDGIRDAGSHVEATAANCPSTRIVLGGFSQGAAVAGYVTAAVVPED